ncbi:PTS sugar transporter subunit IIA [Salinibacterium sp. NG22]|uniref:PTS sugar transporter subunit IIA n=1 Tax=Salinibacterium sp. NG22 TaxID=2792040 RepID=UPI0018CD1842|nr:PTS sugar transporter subunit IIA [Salinibacterium sp. NG22]MBH0109551.1 PTS sugar transporter subunit IIA [Salinibacterium sp. NG22]
MSDTTNAAAADTNHDGATATVVPRADLSFVGLRANSSAEVLTAFATQALAVGAVHPTYEVALLERESAYPTGLPTVIPVAIPHADVEHAIESGLGIAMLAEPVHFGEMGGADSTVAARVAVLILVTEPHAQTEMLTQLIAVFQLDGWHEALSAATTPEELASAFAGLLASTGQ